jgi:hypothetical protein
MEQQAVAWLAARGINVTDNSCVVTELRKWLLENHPDRNPDRATEWKEHHVRAMHLRHLLSSKTSQSCAPRAAQRTTACKRPPNPRKRHHASQYPVSFTVRVNEDMRVSGWATVEQLARLRASAWEPLRQVLEHTRNMTISQVLKHTCVATDRLTSCCMTGARTGPRRIG